MTPADEVGKCPECGSLDKGTRYLINPPALGTFCKNAWHDSGAAREWLKNDNSRLRLIEFTEQEIEIICAAVRGLPNKDIAQELGMAEDAVKKCLYFDICERIGASGRLELIAFFLVGHIPSSSGFRNDELQELGKELARRLGEFRDSKDKQEEFKAKLRRRRGESV